MHFVAAPPDMMVDSVVEYTAVPAASMSSTSSNTENSEPQRNPISISKVIDTEDSYILIGEFRSPTPIGSSEHNLKLMDANGMEIPWDEPSDIDQQWIPDGEVWAVKFDKSYAFPIQVVYSESIVTLDPSRLDTYEFEFDAGSDPQIGESWELNKQIELAGYTFNLASISIRQGGGCGECSSMFEYVFTFYSPDPLTSIELPYPGPDLDYFDSGSAYSLPDNRVNSYIVSIDGYSSPGGSRSITSSTSWEIGNIYPDTPKGKLKIKISDLPGNREVKEWSVDWQPDGIPSSNVVPTAADPVNSPGIRLMDINQTVEANGIGMTLRSLVLNRSHVDALLCFLAPSAKDWWLDARFSLDSDPNMDNLLGESSSLFSDDEQYSPTDPERCLSMGTDVRYEGGQTKVTITIPKLKTSIPESISEEVVNQANQKLADKGIVVAYNNDPHNPFVVVQRPDGATDMDIYPLIWDALADWYEGPWEFIVEVKP
jgi:hypothetical protein